MTQFTRLVKIQVVETNLDPANGESTPSVSVSDIVSLSWCSAGGEQRGGGKGALSKSYFLPHQGVSIWQPERGRCLQPMQGAYGVVL